VRIITVRKVTDNCIKLIEHYEQLYLEPYICPAGVWTIGFGHAIKQGEHFSKITKEEAYDLLKKDLLTAENAVCTLIRVPLENWQYDALVDFVFNLGYYSLQRSALRSKLNRGEYYEASLEFDRWVWAKGRVLRGLVRRRRTERILFQTGELIF